MTFAATAPILQATVATAPRTSNVMRQGNAVALSTALVAAGRRPGPPKRGGIPLRRQVAAMVELCNDYGFIHAHFRRWSPAY